LQRSLSQSQNPAPCPRSYELALKTFKRIQELCAGGGNAEQEEFDRMLDDRRDKWAHGHRETFWKLCT
jgi:hypothetical protein